jgi:hypothetical protein
MFWAGVVFELTLTAEPEWMIPMQVDPDIFWNYFLTDILVLHHDWAQS